MMIKPGYALRPLKGLRLDAYMGGLVIICVALALVAIFGPTLAPYAPEQSNILLSSESPSASHVFGTDRLGRDIFSRVLAGAQISFAAAFVIVAISIVLGTGLALAGAWIGGGFDRNLRKVLNVLFAVPGILVAVLAVAAFGTGFLAPVIALAIVYIPYVARVIYSAAKTERQRSYVEACSLSGLSALQINVRHILPNILPLVVSQATFNFGAAMIDFGAISFIGLGVQPPLADWGLLIEEGHSEVLRGDFALCLSAGGMLILSVVAFNLLGDRISYKMGGSK
jgi:peptide/nickel transport system permease protein